MIDEALGSGEHCFIPAPAWAAFVASVKTER